MTEDLPTHFVFGHVCNSLADSQLKWKVFILYKISKRGAEACNNQLKYINSN